MTLNVVKGMLLHGLFIVLLLEFRAGKADNISPVEERIEISDRLRSELRECRATLLSISDARDRCEKSILQSEALSHDLQLFKEENGLLRKELSLLQERLDVSLAERKVAESHGRMCQQELELKEAELSASRRRESQAERLLRQNDCEAIKFDVKLYRERAEEARSEIEVLRRKLERSNKCCLDTVELSNQIADVEEQKRKVESMLKVAEAEVLTTKHALESLLSSLAIRQKLEALEQEHENEWLPYWLDKKIQPLVKAAESMARESLRASTKMFEVLMRSTRKGLGEIARVLSKTSTVALDVAKKHGRLSKLPGIGFLEQKTRQITRSLLGALRMTFVRAINFSEDRLLRLESAIIGRMQASAMLQPLANRGLLRRILSAISLAAIIPPAVAILVYLASFAWKRLFRAQRLREVVHDNLADTTAGLEPKKVADADAALMKYTYVEPQASSQSTKSPIHSLEDNSQSSNEPFEKIFSEPGLSRYAFLGHAVAAVLASEEAFKTSKPNEDLEGLQQHVKEELSISNLASAGVRRGLDAFVKLDASAIIDAHVKALAQDARCAQLFEALLGSRFVESDFDLAKAKAMWMERDMPVSVS